jgi:hypothetical protein
MWGKCPHSRPLKNKQQAGFRSMAKKRAATDADKGLMFALTKPLRTLFMSVYWLQQGTVLRDTHFHAMFNVCSKKANFRHAVVIHHY